MDELKKKRIQKQQEGIEKACEIVDNVANNFDKAFKQKQLNDLYERKFLLEDKIKDTELNAVTRANAKLQLIDVNNGIELLEQEVNLVDEYDIDIDEEAARQFLADNPGVFEDAQFYMDQNDTLDELERTLGLKSEKDKE